MKRTKEEAAVTKGQLIDSAVKLFLQYGYSAVTLQQIADEIGVTRGAFYWHFRSKEEIMMAFCETERHYIEEKMTDLVMIKELPPYEHLKLFLNKVTDNFFDNRRYRNFVELTWFKMEHVKTSDNVNYLKTVSNEYFIEASRKIVSRGLRTGVFKKNTSALNWAIHFAAVINGIYRLYFITPKYMSKEKAMAIIAHLLVSIKNDGEPDTRTLS